MSGGVYGGDEVGALVFDPGHFSLRVGYAGEDFPKSEVPSWVGTSPDTTAETDPSAMDTGSDAKCKKKYHIDTVSLNYPKKGMEVDTYMKDGMIENWDVFEKVMDYSYKKLIQSESEMHPVLFSECPWNKKDKREKICEIMFEKYNVPAFFLVKNAVLAAFANGKSTALVVDSGATHTSAIPVHDGYVLQHAIVKAPIGADFLTTQCQQFLQDQKIDIIPPYMIGGKKEVGEGEPAKWDKKSNLPQVTKSWQDYQCREVVRDFQHSVLQVHDMPYNEDAVASIPHVPYEFPNGYNDEFGVERFKIPEALFDPSGLRVPGGAAMMGGSHIVTTSVGMCDVDLRPALYGNVVVTGGNTILQGYNDRLNRDLSMKTPSTMRFKLTAANGPQERSVSIMKNIWFKRRYRGVDLSTNPSSRTRINSDNEDNEKAAIKIFGHHREIKLVNLRMILVFMNLIVLAASFVSYLAWMDAKYNWQLENTDRPDRRILAAIEYLPALSPSSQKIVASVHGHLDQLLYLTAFNMFLYWVIYGFVISCRFGGTCDICTIVVSLPHSIIMIVWEIGIASAILRVHTIFSSLPWKDLAIDNSQHYKDLRYVHDFYSTWGPWIVTLYFLSVPVQIFLISLPFLVSRLPFQEKYQQSLEMTPQAASEISMIETTEREHKVKKKRQSFVKLLTFPGTARIHKPVTFPGTARIHRPGDLSNSVVERKGLNNSYPSTTTTTTNHQTSLSGDFRQNNSRIEYIEETQDPSLLADKSKKRYKHFATKQYDCACKAISAGKAVIETMGRTYHVHNSSRPLWNLLEKPVTPHYRLAGRDFLAGGVSIYENYPPRNYLNMASPPPPYSLHPRADYVNLAATNKEEEINMENKDNNDSYVSIDLHHHNDPQFQADLYCQGDLKGQDLDLDITHGNHENSTNGRQTNSANHFIQSVCCTINHSQHASCTNHHGSQHANCTNLHGSEQDFDEHLEQLGGQQDWSETSIII